MRKSRAAKADISADDPRPRFFDELEEIFHRLEGIWPFRPQTRHLEILSSVPPILVSDFPVYEHLLQVPPILVADMAERRAVAEGKNAKFERIVGELLPLRIPREELLDLTTVEVNVYRWAIDQSKVIDDLRPKITLLKQRYTAIVHALRKTPAYTPAAISELALVLRYLGAIPTKRALARWRRNMGIRGDNLLKLHEWTKRGTELVARLEGAKRRVGGQRAELDEKRFGRGFAERAAAALLHARYPAIFPQHYERQLRLRINRK